MVTGVYATLNKVLANCGKLLLLRSSATSDDMFAGGGESDKALDQSGALVDVCGPEPMQRFPGPGQVLRYQPGQLVAIVTWTRWKMKT